MTGDVTDKFTSAIDSVRALESEKERLTAELQLAKEGLAAASLEADALKRQLAQQRHRADIFMRAHAALDGRLATIEATIHDARKQSSIELHAQEASQAGNGAPRPRSRDLLDRAMRPQVPEPMPRVALRGPTHEHDTPASTQ